MACGIVPPAAVTSIADGAVSLSAVVGSAMSICASHARASLRPAFPGARVSVNRSRPHMQALGTVRATISSSCRDRHQTACLASTASASASCSCRRLASRSALRRSSRSIRHNSIIVRRSDASSVPIAATSCRATLSSGATSQYRRPSWWASSFACARLPSSSIHSSITERSELTAFTNDEDTVHSALDSTLASSA